MDKPVYYNWQIEEAINQVVHSERDRKLLRRRYIDGIIFEALAEEMDMSVIQCKRICKRYRRPLMAFVQALQK